MRWTPQDLATYRSRGLKAMHTATRTAPAAAPKPPKYRNTKVTDSDGLTHDSKREYRRWQELQLRELAGEISNLRRQVVFDLVVGDLLVCRYIADALYVDSATGAQICEDTKSIATRKNRVYILKKKLMKACHGIDILET